MFYISSSARCLDTNDPLEIEVIGDTVTESENQVQTWFLSRTLNTHQTDSILYHCRDMITGEKPISAAIWNDRNVDKSLNLNWKKDVHESVKSMKRKYGRDTSKEGFVKALEIARKRCCYS